MTYFIFILYSKMVKSSVAWSSRRSSQIFNGFPLAECNPLRNADDSSQEDCMPFPLDDDSSGPEGSPSFMRRMSSMKSTYGFSLDSKVDRRERVFNTPNNMDLASKYSSASRKPEITGFRIDSVRPSDVNVNEPVKSMEQGPMKGRSRGTKVFHYISLLILILYYLKKCVAKSYVLFIVLFVWIPQLWIHWSWLIRIMFLYLDRQWMCHLPQPLLPSQVIHNANQGVPL